MSSRLKIGAGGAHTADRIEPAVELSSHAELDYLVFESISEISIGLAVSRAEREDAVGYSELLDERMRKVLSNCVENDVTVVTNMGVADPAGARERTIEVARELGLSDLSVASVTGSDVSDSFDEFESTTYAGESTRSYEDSAIAANAYKGVDGMVDALEAGADVVVTDRVADVSLYLAPMVHEFGWSVEPSENPELIGQGLVAGHLGECAGQASGGYFADPGYKDVPGLSDIGFPILEVSSEGDVVVTKLPDTGGVVSERTCKEQLLYEVHDPSEYLTPDGVADFTNVTLEQVGPDRVEVRGGRATPRPETLKVNISYVDSYVGEGQKSYGGHGAVERARMAGDVVVDRLDALDVSVEELRVELIGVDSLHGDRARELAPDPYEVRLRVAGRCETSEEAARIGREVQRLGTNGPAGGGGRTMNVERKLGVASTLVPRSATDSTVTVSEV